MWPIVLSMSCTSRVYVVIIIITKQNGFYIIKGGSEKDLLYIRCKKVFMFYEIIEVLDNKITIWAHELVLNITRH